jgi:hypothetical protein
MSDESLREKLEDPYRMRCPEGHAQVAVDGLSKTKPTIHCEECRMSYRFEELIDMQEQTGVRSSSSECTRRCRRSP